MDLELRDRVYLVTGGSRGLGFAAAEALTADGARVALSAPHEATASAAAARLAQDARGATWNVADNGDPATPRRLIAAARDRSGPPDGALISVGGTSAGTVATTTDEAWRSAFESVFLGAVRLARDLAADLSGPGESGAAGIRINGLLPVRIATDRVRELDGLSGDPDEVRTRQPEQIPLLRCGEPEEFGRAAALLLSAAASYITGAMIPVDGGAIRSI